MTLLPPCDPFASKLRRCRRCPGPPTLDTPHTHKRLQCPWGGHETWARVIRPFEGGCMMAAPWRYYCCDCDFPMPSEDAYYNEFPGIDPAAWLAQLRAEWDQRCADLEAV